MAAIQDFFFQHPVFRREELVRHLEAQKGRGLSANTARELLRYHQVRGHLLAVRRGLYAFVRPGFSPASSPVDTYLVASKGVPDGVLAYHSALELHGLAYSTFETIQVVTKRILRTWHFRGIDFRPIKAAQALGDEALTLGVQTMDRSGQDILVTTPERTFVDVLDRPDLGGGWEEIWRSLEGLSILSFGEVVAYVKRLANATTASRVGYFLEQHRDLLSVDETVLASLERLRPTGVHYMDPREGGHLAQRWNLIVPDRVASRRWEEPQ
ncbi:type IV toxin-antitoxin system AbiEi family antitoxin domain-containing protein [Mesoterricola sediminis]|uniref:type IV toxin-antitoxin system AbiEi family antitoxin domain-containing protein n=1 Tax=Mesoterricola sediminis TaxID=2927980 RepID=UPI001FAF044A|nr:type IV toxin-antitoxin system AbiEi family antitoxin [Mesoterricola sediminis]